MCFFQRYAGHGRRLDTLELGLMRPSHPMFPPSTVIIPVRQTSTDCSLGVRAFYSFDLKGSQREPSMNVCLQDIKNRGGDNHTHGYAGRSYKSTLTTASPNREKTHLIPQDGVRYDSYRPPVYISYIPMYTQVQSIAFSLTNSIRNATMPAGTVTVSA
jgi:hypothetical protein